MFDLQDDSKLNARFFLKPEGYGLKIRVLLHASKGQVRTLQNRNLVSVHVLPIDNSLLLWILDEVFLQYKESDYLIPRHHHTEVKGMK